ncbi:MAG: hypothetical protein IJV04_10535 [Lachnospiraceae bacterium]|nr:hypothetical protein [Lachnospiraceae bacterium]
MKKRFAAMMLAMGLALTACGGGAKTDGGAASGDAATEVGKDAGGYTFEVDGNKVSIGVEAEPVLDELGEPLSYYEAESCAFGDLDKVWTYNGYTIYTYQVKEVDYIYDIVISSDAVSTPEGVSIGDAVDDVKEAYGDPEKEDDGQLVYRKGEMRLIFLVSDGKVSSIDYQSSILE